MNENGLSPGRKKPTNLSTQPEILLAAENKKSSKLGKLAGLTSEHRQQMAPQFARRLPAALPCWRAEDALAPPERMRTTDPAPSETCSVLLPPNWSWIHGELQGELPIACIICPTVPFRCNAWFRDKGPLGRPGRLKHLRNLISALEWI